MWDAISDDMRTVVRAHGGISTDCMDAMPDDWKMDGAQSVWIFKANGAVQKVYTFNAAGKLISAAAP
jgi:hypothetical protein